MQRLSKAEFDSLARGARTLSADEHGLKVLLTPDGRVIKLFRRKRLLSSTLVYPYARRFERASRELAARNIPAAMVERIARVPKIRRDIVVYRHLPGQSLRETLAAEPDSSQALPALARLVAVLHRRGVYFRAAHFGNFLMQPLPSGGVGIALIDLSETRFRRGPLSPSLRARNFRPMTRYAEDIAAIQAHGVDRFVSAYLEVATLSQVDQARFLTALRRVHAAFASAAPPSV